MPICSECIAYRGAIMVCAWCDVPKFESDDDDGSPRDTGFARLSPGKEKKIVKSAKRTLHQWYRSDSGQRYTNLVFGTDRDGLTEQDVEDEITAGFVLMPGIEENWILVKKDGKPDIIIDVIEDSEELPQTEEPDVVTRRRQEEEAWNVDDDSDDDVSLARQESTVPSSGDALSETEDPADLIQCVRCDSLLQEHEVPCKICHNTM